VGNLGIPCPRGRFAWAPARIDGCDVSAISAGELQSTATSLGAGRSVLSRSESCCRWMQPRQQMIRESGAFRYDDEIGQVPEKVRGHRESHTT
jgi:hypothetical protein